MDLFKYVYNPTHLEALVQMSYSLKSCPPFLADRSECTHFAASKICDLSVIGICFEHAKMEALYFTFLMKKYAFRTFKNIVSIQLVEFSPRKHTLVSSN